MSSLSSQHPTHPSVELLELRCGKAKCFTKTAYLSECGFLSEISLASASSQKITCAREGGRRNTPSFCPFLFTSTACPVLSCRGCLWRVLSSLTACMTLCRGHRVPSFPEEPWL